MIKLNSLAAAALAAALPIAVHAEAPSWPAGIDLSRGVDVDEDYRAQFLACDTADTFHGVDLGRRSCFSDPNRVTVLRRLPGGAIAYVSKLSIDFDGSPLACGPNKDRSDQCDTSLELPDGSGAEIPVDADRIPYVVIPRAGPDEERGVFTRLTGVRVGDFGVVIWRGKVAPVIVADTGPYNKLGEGSLALHRALGRDPCAVRDETDTCLQAKPQTSIGADVVTILFPGSALPKDRLDPATFAETVRREALRRWAAYQSAVMPKDQP